MYLARFQAAPELVERLRHLKHRNSVLSKYTNRLQEKISRIVEVESVGIDEETDEFIRDVTESPECCSHINALSATSFQKVFWSQQVEAAKKKKASSMRWHPLMIRWCLFLRHK